MEIKRPVYWHQGLFLQPQHFQLADAYQRFLLKPLQESAIPYFWGVGGLEVATGALANRTFDVVSGRFMLRDGAYLEIPGNAVVKPRSFEGAWTDSDRPFDVFLGVRRLSDLESNVTVTRSPGDIGEVTTRFVTSAEPEEIRDVYGDGPDAQYRALTYVVRVFWADELERAGDYELIHAIRLEKDGETVRLAARFVPPCYAIGASPVLLKAVRDVRDELAGRSRQLEEYKSPREMQKAEFDASYMVYLLALRSLNRYVPTLFAYTEAPQVHPWLVYGTLRQLIGELSSFSERFNMLGVTDQGEALLPAYDHEDIGKCMHAAQSLIGQLLNEITIGPELLARLELNDGYFTAELPKTFFGGRNRFYMVLRTEHDLDEALHSFQAEAKLGARDHLPALISRALPGVELIHMPVAPQGLPRRSYSMYFRVEQISEQWEFVERQGNVALYWGNAPDDLKVELVGLRR